MLTLALDASTYAGSVAVLAGQTVLAERTTAMRGAHEERLMPAVASALGEVGAAPRDVDRIVCGAGPGSFTSLRIAGSIAKGLAVGTSRPLYAVSSLVLLVAAEARARGRYLAVLGALRDEVYAQVVEVGADGAVDPGGDVRLVGVASLEAVAREEGAEPIGPGTRRNTAPHARGTARLGGAAGLAAPVDVIAWEPNYGRLAEAQVRWEAAHGRPLTHG